MQKTKPREKINLRMPGLVRNWAVCVSEPANWQCKVSALQTSSKIFKRLLRLTEISCFHSLVFGNTERKTVLNKLFAIVSKFP